MSFYQPLVDAVPPLGFALYAAFGLAFLAGVVRGFSGFGTAMVLTAPMAVLFSPAVAVPIVGLVDPVASLRLWRPASKLCDWRVVMVITAGAAIGSPLGVYALSVIDPELMSTLISVILLASVAILATGFHFKGEPGVTTTASTGFSAGFLGGMTGLAGPPVVLFFLGGKNTAHVTRANIIMFFALSTFVSMAAFLWRDLLTWEVVALSVVMIPFYVVGLSVGTLGFGKGGAKYYRSAVLTLVAIIGVVSLLA